MRPDEIFIIDSKQIINYNNLFYVQLELCNGCNNLEKIKLLYNLDKNIIVIKNTNDFANNIYWNLLEYFDSLDLSNCEEIG